MNSGMTGFGARVSGLMILAVMSLLLAGCGEPVADLGNIFGHKVSPATVTVARGETGSTTATVWDLESDFVVTLDLIDDVIGPYIVDDLENVTFSPGQISNTTSSLLEFRVPASAQPDTYDMLVKFIWIDEKFETAELRLIVPQAVASLDDIDPISIPQGEDGIVQISITVIGADPIRLEVDGLPAGVTGTFDPNPTTTHHSELTLTVEAAVPIDDYNILVSAFNGDTPSGLKGFVLTVTDPTPPLWTDVTPAGTAPLNDVFFSDETTGCAVGANGTIISSGNGGLAGGWTTSAAVTSEHLNGVHAGGSVWYAVGNAGTIVRNTGGGWESVPSDITNDLLDVFVVDQDKIFISASDGKVYRTENGGTLWDELEPQAGAAHLVTGVWVNGGDTVTAVTSGSGRIHRSENNGTDWTSLSTAMLNDVKFVNGSLGHAVGQLSHIYTTTDGGITWPSITLTTLGPNLNSVSFHDADIGYVVGHERSIWRTVDGGAAPEDWTEESSGPGGSDVLRGVAALNGENAVAVGSTGSVGLVLRR